MFYVRELTRSTKEEINAVRRELDHLQKAGLLKSEKRGNRSITLSKPPFPSTPSFPISCPSPLV